MAWCRFLLIMTEELKHAHPDWPALLHRVTRDLSTLSAAELFWLNERLGAIETLQVALDDLFCKANGLASCSGCDGACCGCGRHHLTMTNLLAYLLKGEQPPTPDFDRTCPFLGERGCLLAVGRRPYNCITFFCDSLEEQLNEMEREQLRILDCQLRSEYQSIAERYPAASLRGLWIALERVGPGQLLRSIEKT